VNGKTWLAIDGVYGYDTFQAIRWPYHENADLNAKFKCLY
jgi:hypothetical protein